MKKKALARIAKKHGVDAARLAEVVYEAEWARDGARYWADHPKSNLHELRDPLARVISLLSAGESPVTPGVTANMAGVILALAGEPPTRDGHDGGCDHAAIEAAAERYNELLRDLRRIERALPPPPPPRGRGRLSKTKDLRPLVEALVDCWEKATGKRFKQAGAWSQGEPVTKGGSAEFVWDVVETIDRKALGSLKKVMARIVADRRPRFP